ncbi:MAG: hypothetical protein PHI41_01700 [Erysipelotrichaceae bacterium]|nr:hypothetical protein [Erysipelotrichaceae bacterium]MDD3809563.1 hypothetical protein [Erysipelotrichaceae bacterium]
MSFYNTRNRLGEIKFDYEDGFENEDVLAYEFGLELDESDEEEIYDFTKIVKRMSGVELLDIYQYKHELSSTANNIIVNEMARRKLI